MKENLLLFLALCVGFSRSTRPSISSAHGKDLVAEINGFKALAASEEWTDVSQTQEAGVPESAAWLNTLMVGLWPNFRKAMKKLIFEDFTPVIQAELGNHSALKVLADGFTIRGDIGNKPPRFGPVKTYKHKDGKSIKLQVGLDYQVDDADITLGFKLPLVGSVNLSSKDLALKSLTVKGDVIILLDQLLDEFPVVGGVGVHFLDPPDVEFDLNGILGFGDWPGIRKLLRQCVDKWVVDYLVMPHQISYAMGTVEQGVDMARLERPPPLGQLKVILKTATGLEDRDGWLGQDHSDPYVVVKVGSETWTSSVQEKYRKTDNGKFLFTWPAEEHLFDVWDADQVVKINVWDDDYNTDDHLGRVEGLKVLKAVSTDLSGVPAVSGKPLTLYRGGQEKGFVTLDFEWLPSAPSSVALPQSGTT